jgi:hypothetical protein
MARSRVDALRAVSTLLWISGYRVNGDPEILVTIGAMGEVRAGRSGSGDASVAESLTAIDVTPRATYTLRHGINV